MRKRKTAHMHVPFGPVGTWKHTMQWWSITTAREAPHRDAAHSMRNAATRGIRVHKLFMDIKDLFSCQNWCRQGRMQATIRKRTMDRLRFRFQKLPQVVVHQRRTSPTTPFFHSSKPQTLNHAKNTHQLLHFQPLLCVRLPRDAREARKSCVVFMGRQQPVWKQRNEYAKTLCGKPYAEHI